MESSRVNSNGERAMTEENPAAMYRRGGPQLQLSQFEPDTHDRALEEQLFRLPTGFDVQTLESSFAMLSLGQQNPLLDNRWTNRSSSSSLQNQGINGGGGGWPLPPQREEPMMNHYLHLEKERMGPIALLATDPDSSLLLQKKIDAGSKETIDVIFNGVISSFPELMVHRFASQVLQKLMHKCSSQQITAIIDEITLHQFGFIKMCIDPVGTRLIQSLLRCLRSEEQILRVVRAVSIGVLAFTRSNGAKHVIMQCFNQFPPSLNRNLIEVLAQNCFGLAIDQYGCCMLQQCLGTGCEVLKIRLIREIIANALRLCVNNFGNYVVQYVLELNDPNVTISLVLQLQRNYATLSRNKYGSHVVQKLLKIQYIDHTKIVRDLLADIDTLLVDPFGNYVIQTAWFVCEDGLRFHLMRHIERNKPLMRCNKFGKKVLDKLNL